MSGANVLHFPRKLPANLEAEKIVLGTLIINPEVLEKYPSTLRPESFAVAEHQRAFADISKNIRAGRPCSMEYLPRWAEATFANMGGSAYLLDLGNSATPPMIAAAAAHALVDYDDRRELIEAAEQTIDQAYSGDLEQTPAEIAAHQTERLDRIVARALNDQAGIIRPIDLAGRDVPPRRWLVPGWIPRGHVTGLYGDGGIGKSLLAMQLLTAAATGHQWLGQEVERVPALGLFCEDAGDELHRRQDAINSLYGIGFADLHDLAWMDGHGRNNVLMSFDPRGESSRTARWHELARTAKQHGARLIVIDTVSDVFAGNENDRNQVSQFIGDGLGRLARELDAAVVLCCHPSRNGLASGHGDSGSTGWNNRVRSRLYLAKRSEDDLAPDDGRRALSRKKSNYAALGDQIHIRYERGAFHLDTADSSPRGLVERLDAKQTFLALLAELSEQGRPCSASINAQNYAPKQMLKAHGSNGFRVKDFERAMNELFNEKRIKVVDRGKSYRPDKQIVAVNGTET